MCENGRFLLSGSHILNWNPGAYLEDVCVCVCACELYGAETWTIRAPDLRQLITFHNQCVRAILGVTRYQR